MTYIYIQYHLNKLFFIRSGKKEERRKFGEKQRVSIEGPQ